MARIHFQGPLGDLFVLATADSRPDERTHERVDPFVARSIAAHVIGDPHLVRALVGGPTEGVGIGDADATAWLRDALEDELSRPPGLGRYELWRMKVPRTRTEPFRSDAPRLSELLPEDEPQRNVEPLRFEVRIVDELGEVVSGVDLVWSQAGESETVTTDGSGVARFERPPGPSFATVRFADVAALRDTMRPLWDETDRSVGATPLEPSDEVSVVFLRDDLAEYRLQLAADTPHDISVQPYVMLARLFGLCFETSKCFLLPTAIPSLRAMKRLYDAHEGSRLLLVGHTDTAGQPSYNDPLSLERADAAAAYLRDDVDAWLAWYGTGKPAEKRWGSREDGLMMTALIGEAETAGQSTTLSFQQWFNAALEAGEVEGEPLTEDGAMGPKTRRALITAYQKQDDTTLPEDVDLQQHGCGENFPLDESGETVDEDAPDDAEDLTDRRVELFFFDGELGVQPPAPGANSAAGSKEYPEWRARTRVVHDFKAGVEVPIFDWDDALDEGMPTDLELTLRDERAEMVIAWRDGARSGTRRRFVFGDLRGDLPCTLVAKTAGNEIVLLDQQTITSADLPIRWDAWLEDLVGIPGPAEEKTSDEGPLPELGPESPRGGEVVCPFS